jgi:hypothetical protein
LKCTFALFEISVGKRSMNRIIMRLSSFFLLLPALILPGLIGASSALAQENKKSSAERKIPFNGTITTPCAEKSIRLNGEFQAQFSVTRDPSGDTFIKADFDAGGITALGITSGRKYQAQGTSHIDSRGPSPIEFTYVFNFVLNKVGTTDFLMGHAKFRINVNASGEATTEIIDVNIDCNKEG